MTAPSADDLHWGITRAIQDRDYAAAVDLLAALAVLDPAAAAKIHDTVHRLAALDAP